MPYSLWEKMKPWVTQVLLLGAVALIAWFVVVPLQSTIVGKMDDIQKLSVMRDYREKQLERLPDLEKQHALILAREKELDIILTKDRLVEFIETLERVAVSENVEIALVSRDNTFLESKVTVVESKDTTKATPAPKAEAGEEAPKKGAPKETGIVTEMPLKKYLRLTITVTGTYENVLQYLHKLETLPYALDVIGINIKAHIEDAKELDAGSGTNPFVPTPAPGEVALPVAPVAVPASLPLRLDAAFETVVYLRE